METIKLTKMADGTYSIITPDANGQWAEIEQSEAVTDALGVLFTARESVRPAWEKEKVNLLTQVREEQTAKAEAIDARNAAETAKVAAITQRDEARNALAGYILASEMTPEQYGDYLAVFPAWETGKTYTIGEHVTYNGTLYKVVQAHTSQADWTPDTVPALFTSNTTPSGEIVPEFVQPQGAHDAYAKGAKVSYNGKVYESLIDANVYTPDAYPQGWKEITA